MCAQVQWTSPPASLSSYQAVSEISRSPLSAAQLPERRKLSAVHDPNGVFSGPTSLSQSLLSSGLNSSRLPLRLLPILKSSLNLINLQELISFCSLSGCALSISLSFIKKLNFSYTNLFPTTDTEHRKSTTPSSTYRLNNLVCVSVLVCWQGSIMRL